MGSTILNFHNFIFGHFLHDDDDISNKNYAYNLISFNVLDECYNLLQYLKYFNVLKTKINKLYITINPDIKNSDLKRIRIVYLSHFSTKYSSETSK